MEEEVLGVVRACLEGVRRREQRARMEGKVWLVPYQRDTE